MLFSQCCNRNALTLSIFCIWLLPYFVMPWIEDFMRTHEHFWAGYSKFSGPLFIKLGSQTDEPDMRNWPDDLQRIHHHLVSIRGLNTFKRTTRKQQSIHPMGSSQQHKDRCAASDASLCFTHHVQCCVVIYSYSAVHLSPDQYTLPHISFPHCACTNGALVLR